MQEPSPASWNPTGTVSLEALSRTRQEIHMGGLVLGSLAHAVLEHRDDDSHANLGVDATHGSLHTHPIQGGVHLHLDIPKQRFVWRDGNESRGEFAMVGKSLAHVFEGLGSFASELLGRDVTIVKREFPDFPDHPVLNGARFEPRPEAELRELVSWFTNGLSLFETLSADPKLSPIRVWPHHFDLGCLLTLTGETLVGLGLSPGDEHYDEPYFYASTYPAPDAKALPEVRNGAWHTEGFVSHVLTATHLAATPDPASSCRAYLEEALGNSRAFAGE